MSARFRPVVEEGCVGVLQGEPAVDQLLGGAGLRRAAAPHRWRHDAAPVRAVSAAATPPVCQNTAGVSATRGQQRPEQGHGLRSVVVIEQQPLVVQRQPRADPILGRGHAEAGAPAVADVDVVGGGFVETQSGGTSARESKDLVGHARVPAGSRWRRPVATGGRTRPARRPARPGYRRSRWPPRPSAERLRRRRHCSASSRAA